MRSDGTRVPFGNRGACQRPRRPARVSPRTCVLRTSLQGSPCGTRVRRLSAPAAKGFARTANPGPCAFLYIPLRARAAWSHCWGGDGRGLTAYASRISERPVTVFLPGAAPLPLRVRIDHGPSRKEVPHHARTEERGG